MVCEIPDKCQKLEPPEEVEQEWFDEYGAVISTIGREVPVSDKDEAIRQLRINIEYIEDAIAFIESC